MCAAAPVSWLLLSCAPRVTIVGCGWVCTFDFSIQYRIGQEDLRITSALQSIDLKHVFFPKTASSQSYRICVEPILPHLSAILLALAGA